MKKILTIAKSGQPVEPSISFEDDAAVDVYLRERFGAEVSASRKMRGFAWLDGRGVARMVFEGDHPDVRLVLPKAGGLVFYIDSEATFEAMKANTVATLDA